MRNKLFCAVAALLANAAIACSQTVFSVEEISRGEYIGAEKESARYNVCPTDSIADNETVDKVLKESQAMFERLDSATREEITYGGDFGFDKRQLLYLPEFKLYGFCIPDEVFENHVWWFDSESGSYIDATPDPTAINTNGLYVSQQGFDCDWQLALRFFRREENDFCEIESYGNARYNGETVFLYPEEGEPRPIFWHGDNVLYLKTHDYKKDKTVYLKIRIQPSAATPSISATEETG